MTPNEIKLTTLKRHIAGLIDATGYAMDALLRDMEKFTISPRDFHERSYDLNIQSFIMTYLHQIMKMAEETDYKTTENFIRFHKYQLEAKAGNEPDEITAAQKAVVEVLSTIIDLYLDK